MYVAHSTAVSKNEPMSEQRIMDDVHARVLADVTRLVGVPHEQRILLFDALGDFDFSMGDMTPDEAITVASLAKLDKEDAFAALRCLVTLGGWKEDADFVHSIERQIPVDKVAELIEDLSRCGEAVSERLSKIVAAEFTMASYRGCTISYDLRGIPVEDRFDIVPIAVVRILLDEGEPVTFQCLPSGLSALAGYLEKAAVALRRLEAQVSPTGSNLKKTKKE